MPIGKQEAYFRKFPLTNYNGQTAVDITKRVNFNNNIQRLLSVFYTYTMERGETVDALAFNYYEKVDYDWLIYLANDIIDPHYGTPMTDLEFNEYIVKKYGSLRTAKRKIIHYTTDYESDDRILSTSAYEALAPTFSSAETFDPDSVGNPKKYWAPVINMTGVVGYQRAKENTIYNTNKIVSFSFDEAMPTPFTVGGIVVKDDDTRGEVVFANTTVCTVKNVIGEFTSETDYAITDDLGKGISGTVSVSTVRTDRQVIPLVETTYFKEVSYYDYEEEINDEKRKIFLVDKANKTRLSNELTEVLK